MNQGKLEVVKQETARLNIDIFRISELKWMGMGEFNSDDQYIYYRGQESLRRNGVALIVNERVQNEVLGCNLKNNRMMCLASAWRTVRPSSREPHDRDLRDPKGLFLLVPGVITGAVVSLADSGSRAHYPPFRMTPHWGAFPTSLNSSS